MNRESDALAILGTAFLLVLGVTAAVWWLAIVAGIVLALCVLALVP